MNIRIFSTADELAMASALHLRRQIERKPDLLCCFAAGRTQIPTYGILADWVKKGELDVSRLRVVGLDDIVGSSRANREGFYYFLDVHLFGPAGIKDEQINFFNAQAPDAQAECERMNRWLDENGPIEYLLLGIGGNGHIGYNEPGAARDGRAHTVELEQSSIAAGQTYFDHSFTADVGITLGLRDLLAAKQTLVQATGESKREAVGYLKAGKVREDVPVTLLLDAPGEVAFFFDEDANATEA